MTQQMDSEAIQQMQSEIAELNSRLEELDEDPRACLILVKDRIGKYRAAGKRVPEELERIERRVVTECLAASQGR